MTGSTVCAYTVRVQFDGKEPFRVGTFKVPRASTRAETEHAANKEAERSIARFWEKHFPDGAIPPHVVLVELGAMTFVPDDYEWRRA